MKNKIDDKVKDQISAIIMDNTATKDAIDMKNYSAAIKILDRQKQEIDKLFELLTQCS